MNWNWNETLRVQVETQERISTMVPGFRFNLGFSGKFHHHGTADENLGDDLLLSKADRFTWFGHMWSHQQAHLYENVSQLEQDMVLNKNFALEKGIPVDSGYSVSPHHSGVYPVHQPLYDMWKKLWGIRVTSTEEVTSNLAGHSCFIQSFQTRAWNLGPIHDADVKRRKCWLRSTPTCGQRVCAAASSTAASWCCRGRRAASTPTPSSSTSIRVAATSWRPASTAVNSSRPSSSTG